MRFEVGLAALAPELKVNAPVRDSGMTRDKAIEFAAAKGLPIDVTARSPYSIDQNLWAARARPGTWKTSGKRRTTTCGPTPPTRLAAASRTSWC